MHTSTHRDTCKHTLTHTCKCALTYTHPHCLVSSLYMYIHTHTLTHSHIYTLTNTHTQNPDAHLGILTVGRNIGAAIDVAHFDFEN